MKKVLIAVLFFLIIILLVKTTHQLNNEPDKKSQRIARELTSEERVLKQTILYNAGDNYIKNAFYLGGDVVRWNTSCFPIKVFISKSKKVPAYYAASFREAVLVWQNAVSDLLKFEFVDNEKDANIIFEIVPDAKKREDAKQEGTSILAYTKYDIKGDKLIHSIIHFYEGGFNGEYLKPNQVLNTATHEMGHALGISGHCDYENSLMYALYDPIHSQKSDFISAYDINTIRLLYKITPDITNGDKNLEVGTIRSEILLGTMDERINEAINALKDELLIKSDDAGVRVELSYLYAEKEDFENAMYYLQEAQKFAKNNDELYQVAVGFANYYYLTGDKKNAKKYINDALKYHDDNETRELLNYINK